MSRYKAIKVDGKKIDEHRHIMEKFLGRKLSFDEIVHHIDGDTRNNNICNLEIKSRSEHAILHHILEDLHKVNRTDGIKGGCTTRLLYGNKVIICDIQKNELMIVSSNVVAAKVTGISESMVRFILSGKRNSKKFFFKNAKYNM